VRMMKRRMRWKGTRVAMKGSVDEGVVKGVEKSTMSCAACSR
jgi:hypothetical protein